MSIICMPSWSLIQLTLLLVIIGNFRLFLTHKGQILNLHLCMFTQKKHHNKEDWFTLESILLNDNGCS